MPHITFRKQLSTVLGFVLVQKVGFQGVAVGQELLIIPQPKIYSVFMFKPCGSRVTWVNYFKRYYNLQNYKV